MLKALGPWMVAAAALGVALVQWSDTRALRNELESLRPLLMRPAPAATVHDSVCTLDPAQLAQLTRSPSAPLAAAPALKPAAPEPKPETQSLSVAEAQARAERVRQADGIVTASIQAKFLRREDVLEMRRLRAETGGGREFDAMTQRMIQALNAQQLKLEDPAYFIP